jgi:DNA-binding PadR family transcriptional regulator
MRIVRRRSHQAKLVMQALLDAHDAEVYGLEIVRASGLSAGTAYGILRRLEDEGLLGSRWEQMDAASEGRPPRRYYRLSGEGRKVAQRETIGSRHALRLLSPGWGRA